VGVVTQFMKNPCTDHWDVIICILRYLKKAPGQGLLYKDKRDTQISGIVMPVSPMDRRSTTGYCFHSRQHYFFKKQNVIARSCVEGEYDISQL